LPRSFLQKYAPWKKVNVLLEKLKGSGYW
jgi:hypothetical protein